MIKTKGFIIFLVGRFADTCVDLILRWGYYKDAHRQMANLLNKVILCVQIHATRFVQVYADDCDVTFLYNTLISKIFKISKLFSEFYIVSLSRILYHLPTRHNSNQLETKYMNCRKVFACPLLKKVKVVLISLPSC